MSSVTAINAMDEQITLTEQEILSEIHRRMVFLTNLRAKRNSFLPVLRLPPETLAIIFIHGARDYYESDIGGCFTSSLPTWVNVSYVCRYWRSVALNCPILWTHHFAHSPRWTEELLLRSKEASLKISCMDSLNLIDKFSWWPNVMDNLLKHSERIQELRLGLPRLCLPPKLLFCAPRLENLDLWGISMQRFTISDWDKFPLHALKLVDCSLPWYSFNLCRLKTLVLRYIDSPSPLKMVEVLAVLSGLPNLTVLHIEHVLPSARDFLSDGGLDVSPKINLPLLTLLVVIEPLSTVVALVSCVNIPPRTQLKLGLLLEPVSALGDLDPIHSFFARQFSQQSYGRIFRSMLLDPREIFTLTFGFEYKVPLSREVGHDIPLKIALGEVYQGDMEGTGLAEGDLMGSICSSLPLRNIQNLHICWPESFSDLWKEMLGCLDGLRHMKLSYGHMPDLSLLSLPACKSEEDPAGQAIPDQDPTSSHMFVPVLEDLELYQITFALDDTFLEGGMSHKSLLDALSTRKGLRDRLTMTECKFL